MQECNQYTFSNKGNVYQCPNNHHIFYTITLSSQLYFANYFFVSIADSRGAVSLLQEFEINVVASLLKQYLRELPEPLLTDALYPRLVQVKTNDKKNYKGSLFHTFISRLEFMQFSLELKNARCFVQLFLSI